MHKVYSYLEKVKLLLQRNLINKTWQTNLKQLNSLIKNDNIDDFLNWDIVKNTMFVSSGHSYALEEYKQLINREDWKSKWFPATREIFFGNPEKFILDKKTSGNIIHHAYHLSQFEDFSLSFIKDYDYIFEFGGGYGNMCKLINNLKFSGIYVIFDLPEFISLQKRYLTSINIPVNKLQNFPKKGVYCTSNINALKKIVDSSTKKRGKKLFISTWAISEVPLNLRKIIINLITPFNAFLIAYQKKFDSINNAKYFKRFQKKLNKVKWNNYEIKHIPNNYYLFGVK